MGFEITMDNSTKWGINCRKNEKKIGKEGRIPEVSKSLDQKYVQFIHILEKVPVFKGLNVAQFGKILNICNKRVVEKNTVICRFNEESHEMFILLKGTLRVVAMDGNVISKIPAIGIVGEMGIFTNEKRSATVLADSCSIILALKKNDLMDLFREDFVMAMTILMNVIKDLSNKLKTNNIIMGELRQIVMSGEFTQILNKVLDSDEE
jgi:signal-transduction protein with cAMP-binding, CBS, and nucleotidyltransferase domain